MKKNNIEIFRDAPVPKAVLTNVIPSIISMIMVLVYNLADTYFISQTNNTLMIAAVSVATPAFLLFMATAMIFGVGGTSLISRTLGEGDTEKAKHASSFCFWTGLGVGILGFLVLYLFTSPICTLIGASADTLEYATNYLSILSFGVPFLIVSNSFSNIIRAEGNATIAMAGMIIGNVVNIVLDPIMILGLGWDVEGAAIATVIGNIASALFYVSHLISKRCILSIHPKYYQVGNHIASGVLAIGVPASLNNILMTISNIVANNIMASYNDNAVAGLGVTMKINLIVVMLLIGIGTGIQPLLGYCYGAGNKKRYMDVFRFSLIMAFAVSIVMTVVCYVGAGPLVNIFLKDPAAAEYGIAFCRTYIYAGPILGILFVFINAIQSTGSAIPAMILSVSRQGFVYLPCLLIYNAVFKTPNMVAGAQPTADYVSMLIAVVLMFYIFRTKFPKD